MKRIVVVAFCLLGVAAAAEWYWLNPKPTGNDLNAVWFVGDTGYVCGPTTIKTTDGGENWTALATGAFEKTQFPVDGHTGYATGYGMNKTTDAGATWTYVKIGDYKSTHDVCFPAGNDTGYATYDADPPKVAKTCDGFATYTTVTLNNVANAFGMAFTDTRHGWVVGGNSGNPGGGFIFRTTDGGTTWTRQDSSHVMGRRDAISVLADGQTAFVCGYQPSLQKTTDGGANWDTLPFPAVDEACEVSFPHGPDTGFVLGTLDWIYRTADGGQTWDSLPGTLGVYAMHFPNGPRVGVAAGFAGMLMKTTDAGASWTNLTRYAPGTLPTTYFMDVDFPVDEATGYAVGNRGVYLKTTDGGQNWTRPCVFDTLASLKAVRFAGNGETGFIAGFINAHDGRVWRSTDGGANWDTVLVGPSGMPCDIEFPHGPDTGFVADRYRCVWRTTNGGDSWTRQGTPGNYLSAADFPTTLVGYAVGEDGTVNKTTDAGETWIDMQTAITINWFDVQFPTGPDTGFICGANGELWKTTDGAGTWEYLNSVSFDWLFSISFPNDAQTGFVAGQSMVMKTTDGGANWLPEPIYCNQNLMAVQFPLDAGTGYAVGLGGTILKTGYGGGIEESPKPQAASSKLGPTIVRGVLNLQSAIYNLQSEIALLDISGRKVLDLKPGANDVSGLAPGVYFVDSELSAVSREPSAVLKVIITR